MAERVAIVTCDGLLPHGDPDDALLVAALAAIGVQTTICSWSDPDVEWDTFDVSVIRSTWDYPDRRDEFVEWLLRTPRLHNPAEVIVGNSDKRYLAELIAAGIPTVPTTFVAPGEPAELPADGEFVIKPTVGSGSRGAGRFRGGSQAQDARAHLADLHREGRTAMIQPYLSAVDSAGETAMVFIAGQFSHAIRKGPMLTADSSHALHSDELYIVENITPRLASDDERRVAEAVLDHVGRSLLYARVDLLPTEDGPVVIEVELSEPSLFLAHSEPSAGLLAEAIAESARKHSCGGTP